MAFSKATYEKALALKQQKRKNALYNYEAAVLAAEEACPELQSIKEKLNMISSGIISALGDISLVKSVEIWQNQFLLTMKNSGINDDNGCEILLVGSDNLKEKAAAGARAYATATDAEQNVDLSGKIITITKENGVFKGIMNDKETP